jgi:hypothetical protein
MTDKELNEGLKRARVPEREAGYWERFPGRVTAEIERREQDALARGSVKVPARAMTHSGTERAWGSLLRFLGTKPAFAVGLATVCLTLGFFLGFWKGHTSLDTDQQLTEVRKYYRELEALFPNQLQAIVFDQKGTHFVLAQEANLPGSTPLYLRICGPEGCQRFVTFSGQQIRFNGEVCDVLTDREGNVLLVGHKMVWSSAQAVAKAGRYRIEAKPLLVSS